MKQKTIIHATLAYKHSFSNYLRYFLDHIDDETVAKFDFLQLKIPITFSTSLTIICCLTDKNMVSVRHSKIAQNKIFMKEVQRGDWQYLVESLILPVKDDKTHLKPLQKK